MCPHAMAHWRHLANTIELSVCGGDAALCQLTLTTCCISPKSYALQWARHSLKLPIPIVGASAPHLIHGSLGPPDSASQTVSRSVQPFCTAYDCDRPTDRQISLRSVTIGGIYDSTLCLKNVPPLTCYDLDKHDPLAISFGRSVTEKVRNQMVLFPTSTV